MSETAFADHILCQVPEEPLYQIKPRATGGREVDYQPVASVLPAVLSISPLEPTAHLWRLVRSVVVHDQMQRQLGGHLLVHFLYKRQPLAVRMSRRQGTEHLAIQIG